MQQIDFDAQSKIAIQKEIRRRAREKEAQLLSLEHSELRELAFVDEVAEKIICEKSFHDFVNFAWKYIDPAEFIDEWFIKFVCDGMQETFKGAMTRLNVNIPPGMSKSMISCVFFPVWLWVKNPSLGVLTGSYAQDNAKRDAIKSRDLMSTDWFQSKWGNLFSMSSDQNQKQFYKNNKMGYRQAFSMLSRGVTGKRANYLILDDALSASDAFSKAYRENVINTINQVVMSRLNDPNKSVVINLGQRLHEEDPSGLFIKKGWPSIILPMEYEPHRKCVMPFGEDKRGKEGELLTARYSEKTLASLKEHYGSYGTAGQLQQRPSPLKGGLIKLDYIKYYKELPTVKKYTWSWDLAVKTGQHNDYSVGQLWAECEDGYYLCYMFRGKEEYPVMRKHIQTLYERYKAAEVIIEDKSSGEPLIQELKKSTSLPIIPVIPGREMPRTKEERVVMVTPTFEAGKIYLPDSSAWVSDLLDEWVSFPNAPHDDTVDAMTQYLCKQRSQGSRVFDLIMVR